MALRTLGTNATTSLQGFVVGLNDPITADLASVTTALRSDPPSWYGAPKGTFRPNPTGFYVKKGRLMIPRRGELVLVDGDFVCWDTTTGWPIVVSADAATNGPYTHT